MPRTWTSDGGRNAPQSLHTFREANLLAARFNRDLILGSTEVFFMLAACGEGGAVTSDGETNASFHPVGRSKTGSSPASSDLIDIRTSASSSSPVGIAAIP